MKKILPLLLFNLTIFSIGFTQGVTLEGYAYETGNRGYLNVVSVTATNVDNGAEISNVFSNSDGFFSLEVPANTTVKLTAYKDMFETIEQEIKVGTEKAFVKLEMKRSPGYVFEITIAEKKEGDEIPTDAIRDSRIEVYNNSTKSEELVLENHPDPEFSVNLIKGNHYTILIRKDGYLAKRMEAFVDVENCILCFEGLGDIRPGVSDNLTEGNQNGVLLANVEMEKLFTGKKIEIQNIYFDFNRYAIKSSAAEELNKVIRLMMDNPEITIEMGSHTDSRGSTEDNQILSEKRAKATVDYLLTNGDIRKNRIYYQGYGESQLVNECADGVDCSEAKHAKNRRTELKIINIKKKEELKTLAQMKKEEELERMILELGEEGQIKLEEGEKLEDKIKEKNEDNDSIQPLMLEEHVDPPNFLGEQMVFSDSGGKPLQGAVVVLISSSTPLPEGHSIFSRHEDVSFSTDEENNIMYFLKYDSKEDAEMALKNTLKKMYPKAFVRSFKDGFQID